MSTKEQSSVAIDFNRIFDIHIKYIDYLLTKSLFSHQDTKNTALCGSEIEEEIREFFKNILPSRFRVTHGYIISSTSKTEKPNISPQVDLIIVDELVMNKVFTLDKRNGMEIVPVESVVGIFEIKRKLTSKSFKDANEHLVKIKDAVNLTKNDSIHYLPGGITFNATNGFNLTTGIHSNPFVGIISLDYNQSNMKKTLHTGINSELIDAVFSFSGMAILNSKNNIAACYNKKTGHVPSIYMDTSAEIAQTGIISRFFGYLQAYLTFTCGRILNIENYFFHDSTWRKSL